MDAYPPGFEGCEDLRSNFIRHIMLRQMELEAMPAMPRSQASCTIPKKLLRYWHDPADLPDDVSECLSSWNCLVDHDFELYMFGDSSGAAYIASVYGEREQAAFARCSHPAMRCDYFRMCFILAEGGFYVDADDVLLGDGWRELFRDDKLKLQPLCYDISAGGMLPAPEIWRDDLSSNGHVFYVNNDPIVAPARHPILERALTRATTKLLGEDPAPEIQSTTGPGNLTAALAAHARELEVAGLPNDYHLLCRWDSIAEMRWGLSYRQDERNWRNVYGC
jgi:hypothetical protein